MAEQKACGGDTWILLVDVSRFGFVRPLTNKRDENEGEAERQGKQSKGGNPDSVVVHHGC